MDFFFGQEGIAHRPEEVKRFFLLDSIENDQFRARENCQPKGHPCDMMSRVTDDDLMGGETTSSVAVHEKKKQSACKEPTLGYVRRVYQKRCRRLAIQNL